MGPNDLNGKKGNQPLWAVWGVDNDPIALSDAQITKTGGKPLDGISQFFVRIFFSQINNGCTFWIFLTDLIETGKEVRVSDHWGFALFCHLPTLPFNFETNILNGSMFPANT
jgi:hypothetical protein